MWWAKQQLNSGVRNFPVVPRHPLEVHLSPQKLQFAPVLGYEKAGAMQASELWFTTSPRKGCHAKVN